MAKLLRAGRRPEIVALAVVHEDHWKFYERLVIAGFRAVPGSDLLNLSDGGDGSSGYRHTREARRKMSDKVRGRKMQPFTAEARANMSAAAKGKPKPWQKGKPAIEFTPEVRAKISAAIKGKKLGPQSEDRRKKTSDVMSGMPKPWQEGRPRPPEVREKIRASLMGRKRPADVVAKIIMAKYERKALRAP